jgi:hypothetical protein
MQIAVHIPLVKICLQAVMSRESVCTKIPQKLLKAHPAMLLCPRLVGMAALAFAAHQQEQQQERKGQQMGHLQEMQQYCLDLMQASQRRMLRIAWFSIQRPGQSLANKP